MTVPIDVLASSTYPAVLDPLIGPEHLVLCGCTNNIGLTAAHNGSRYLMAAHLATLGVQERPVTYVMVENGGSVANPTGVAVGGSDGSHYPAMAANPSGFLIAWGQRNPLPGGPSSARVARVDSGGQLLDPTGIILPAAPVGSITTQAGYDIQVASDGTNYLAVWSAAGLIGSDQEVVGIRISEAGTLMDAAPFIISDDNVAAGRYSPTITWSGTSYVVAWSDQRGTVGSAIRASLVSPAGVVSARATQLVSGPVLPDHRRYPSIASNGATLLLGWQTSASSGTGPASFQRFLPTLVPDSGVAGGATATVNSSIEVAWDGLSYVALIVGSSGSVFGYLPGSGPFPSTLSTVAAPVSVENLASHGGGVTMLVKRPGFHFISNFAQGMTCSQDSECISGFCADGVCCDQACGGSANDCQACSLAAGATANGTCSPVNAGMTCRAGNGACDVAETCTGATLTCPADGFAAASQVCRAAVPGGCDVAETCTGTSAACPSDVRVAAGTVCRPAAAGGCDVAEACTGASASCPADGFRPSSFVCRTATGLCDVADTCSGTGAVCPTDQVAPPTTVCRAANGACDVAEQCSGVATSCPADGYQAAGTTCRPAVPGGCDVGEACTGSAASCPTDVVVPAGTTCRAATGTCDLAETCTGSATCPVDMLAPVGTVCRAAAPGGCDLAETCGGAIACPADVLAPAGTQCRGSTDACDPAEQCAGGEVVCPADVDTDLDADAVCAVSDNCVDVSNPGQDNHDSDLLGDACDDDDDNDGLTDVDEQVAGTNPISGDSDGDSIPDRDEVGADPATPPNSDGSGEVDALDLDSDDDGTPDADEAGDADLGTAPLDTDGDGVPDYRDLDADGDGVADATDNCRLVMNADQADVDDNQVGDACQGDADGDSIGDATDNCPAVSNADQANHDADAQGDACDADDDGDSVVDDEDNCPNVGNPDQADADGDDVGDACDSAGPGPDAAPGPDAGGGSDGGAAGGGTDDPDSVVGCGCQSQAGSGAGGALAWVLGLVAWRRARRRRPMHPRTSEKA
ncbi:MAG: thrombospondin type 3 repeat-containing protein [Kofleriaceae bacterium]|nr:thrombospondin type 3 repeat-containing protein [Kofleriaceae bacterium]